MTTVTEVEVAIEPGRVVSPNVTLRRVAVRQDGAFGVLLWHTSPLDYVGSPFAVTLERTYDTPANALVPPGDEPITGYPQGDGTIQYVKVPRGRWVCARRWFTKGGYYTYEVAVPGHAGILFHKGSVEAHSEGCVLVGRRYVQWSTGGIADTAEGLSDFLGKLAGRAGFLLEVA